MLISISCVDLIKWTVYAIDINMILHTVFTKFADIRLQEYIDDKYSVKTQEYRVCELLLAPKKRGDFISYRVLGSAHNDLAKNRNSNNKPTLRVTKHSLIVFVRMDEHIRKYFEVKLLIWVHVCIPFQTQVGQAWQEWDVTRIIHQSNPTLCHFVRHKNSQIFPFITSIIARFATGTSKKWILQFVTKA